MTEHKNYSTPLAQKLGVSSAGAVVVVGPAPDAVLAALAVTERHPRRAEYDVIVAFCPDHSALQRHADKLAERISTAGALWLCWPKRSSGVVTDIGETDVRGAGLDAGLVDVKVAAVDAVWSGLKFVRRRER